jgi:hypothetical protein
VSSHFIVSTGKCGSTLVSRILARHPAVLSISELFAAVQPRAFPAGVLTGPDFWRLLSEPHDSWTSVLRARNEPSELLYPIDAGGRFSRDDGVAPIAAVCLPALTDEPDQLYGELERVVPDFPAAAIGDHYRALFSHLMHRFQRRLWVERSGGSLQYVRSIVDHFPDAGIVHLHRDGRETSVRMSKHPYFQQALTAAPITGDQRDGSDIPVERVALRWAATLLNGTAVLARLPQERVLHVAYENLVAAPALEISRILSFLRLEKPKTIGWEQYAVADVQEQALSWTALAKTERTRLDRICAVAEHHRKQLR